MSKSEVKIYHGAMVCKETKIRGDVTIGSMSIVHPCANIIAESGPIVIGDGNIIEEQVVIINKAKNETNESPVLRIGNNNVFEVGCRVETMNIGDNNVLECKSYLGPGVELGVGCVIGAGCRLTIPEKVPDNTVIFGKNCTRRLQPEIPPAQNLQRDFLTKMLPNYHHLRKSKSSTQTTQPTPQD